MVPTFSFRKPPLYMQGTAGKEDDRYRRVKGGRVVSVLFLGPLERPFPSLVDERAIRFVGADSADWRESGTNLSISLSEFLDNGCSLPPSLFD